MFSKSAISLALAGLMASGAFAQIQEWQQCGTSIGFSDTRPCVAGSVCVVLNPYYAQCQPGVAPPTITSTTVAKTTSTSTSARPSSTSSIVLAPSTTTSAGGVQPTAGAGPGSTLLNGYYWIRAVAAPNFHMYLQGETPRAVSKAVLKTGTTAGQFNIVSGQLVQLVSTSASPATLLYARVTRRVASENTLLLTWETTPDTYGTFSWSGDTLQWSTAGISRPNNAAWLVCDSQRVYVNLGPYLYQTPAGCADQTIHYYNGATADL